MGWLQSYLPGEFIICSHHAIIFAANAFCYSHFFQSHLTQAHCGREDIHTTKKAHRSARWACILLYLAASTVSCPFYSINIILLVAVNCSVSS